MLQIYLNKHDRKELKKQYSCCDATLTNALTFKTHSVKSMRMRVQAVNYMKGYLLGN